MNITSTSQFVFSLFLSRSVLLVSLSSKLQSRFSVFYISFFLSLLLLLSFIWCVHWTQSFWNVMWINDHLDEHLSAQLCHLDGAQLNLIQTHTHTLNSLKCSNAILPYLNYRVLEISESANENPTLRERQNIEDEFVLCLVYNCNKFQKFWLKPLAHQCLPLHFVIPFCLYK